MSGVALLQRLPFGKPDYFKAFVRYYLFIIVFAGRLGGLSFAQPSSLYKETEVAHGGSIHGFVRLSGKAVDISTFDVTKDAKCCGTGKPSPRLVIGKGNGVKNTIVYVEGIREGKKFSSAERPRLVQQRCEYGPHITVLRLGSDLEICNNDPILHNVHGYSFDGASHSLFNIAQPVKGQRSLVKSKQLSIPGIIQTSCDAGHPWMSAYVMVVEHPYVAVTDDNGEFTIGDIPPGKYILRMWHEGIAVTHKEVEEGKVKKYVFEEPYEASREIVVSPDEKVETNLMLTLR